MLKRVTSWTSLIENLITTHLYFSLKRTDEKHRRIHRTRTMRRDTCRGAVIFLAPEKSLVTAERDL